MVERSKASDMQNKISKNKQTNKQTNKQKANKETTTRRKKKKLFFAAVRQMMTSQVLPNANKNSVACTYCCVSFSPVKFD